MNMEIVVILTIIAIISYTIVMLALINTVKKTKEDLIDQKESIKYLNKKIKCLEKHVVMINYKTSKNE